MNIRSSKFGLVPPSNEEILKDYLRSNQFVITGSEKWNALGLSTTAVFVTTLVYNKKYSYSESIYLYGRPFLLRLENFPEPICLEWLIVDLFNNAEQVSSSFKNLIKPFKKSLLEKKFDYNKFMLMLNLFGSERNKILFLNEFGESYE